MQFENTDGRKDIHETWRETDRNVLIDFWKIAAILLIVVSHQFYLDPAESNYHFRKAWIYVEMFFLLSGYFACIHFRKNPSAHIDDASKEALTYTVRKWLSFLPYVVPAVILQYGLNQIRYPKGLVGFLHQLEKMPRDLMLLTSVSGKAAVGPLWYLSAMLLALPILGICFQLVSKHLLVIIAAISGLLYYGITDLSDRREVPHDFLRGFVCMLMGALICYIVEQLQKTGFRRVLALAAGECMLIYTVLTTYSTGKISGYARMTILIAFIVGLSFLLYAGRTFDVTPAVKKTVAYLTDLSFNMYIWQKCVATIVCIAVPQLSDQTRLFLYLAGTICAAFISKYLIGGFTRWLKKADIKKIFCEPAK